MRYRISCGVIPFHKDTKGIVRFLLVQGHGNFWGFPKGHKKNNETHMQTATRELLEETQITCNSYLGNTMFTERYRIPKRKGTDIIKKVLYFVGNVSETKVTRQTAELKNHGWFTLKKAEEKLIDNRIEILRKVYEMVR